MFITFPHMGSLYIALEGIFNYLGVNVILPPPINKETIKLGTKNTPEAACLPFKIVLGNFTQALDAGADTIVMLGGEGPCRFGYFGALAKEILTDMGYSFNMIILEKNNFFNNVNIIRHQSGASWWQTMEAIRFGWAKLNAIDQIEKLTLISRPREKSLGVISRLFDEALHLIRKAKSISEVKLIEKKCTAEIRKCTAEKEVLRIGLVGDIYMMLEPSVNHRVERLLGAMGVEIDRSIYASDWLKHTLLPHQIYKYKKTVLTAGKPYLKDFVGGHGLDTVANTVLYARDKFDGVIQILPMTCMPEIVAQSVLPNIQQDLDIPVMTIVLDEHSNEAGFVTRIEAFVDLLKRKKENYILAKKAVE